MSQESDAYAIANNATQVNSATKTELIIFRKPKDKTVKID